MGFLSGRVTYERFRVAGAAVNQLGSAQIETLERFAIGKGSVAAEGVELGFTAGDHILDLNFQSEKNIVNDALHFAMRIDANKPPADLKRAYFEMELAALTAANPSGYPTRRQKAEAKAAAEERCAQEAADGRFRQMKHFPILWDIRQNTVYFGGSSQTAIDRFSSLFREAFDRDLERVTAGRLAYEIAAGLKQQRSFEDLGPSAFTGPVDRNYTVSWLNEGQGAHDFLGNEFLMWLWWVLVAQTDAVKLTDESTVVCMMARVLSLECPLAETGKETITHESPIRLPEAKRAVLSGKLPRKSGLIVVRHDEQYAMTLTAETLAVAAAALPKLDVDSEAAERSDRIDQIRHLTETLDELYGAFIRRRIAGTWTDDLKKLRIWMQKED